jgi:hypothetical protein
MKASGFDGIDIDWEFPGINDKHNYTRLLEELRVQLDARGVTDGKRYILTAALPAGRNEYAHLDLGEIHQYLDWINLLAYDFYNAFSPVTHFSSPLYTSPDDPEPDSTKRSSHNVAASVHAYLAAGVPANKLVVGVPFFGIGWEGVANANNGLYQSATGPAQGTWHKNGVFDFLDLTNNYVPNALRYWSAEASSPWLYDPDSGTMITYVDPQSLGLRADYIVANNLAGVMIWQLSADDAQSSLVNTLSAHLNPLSATPSPMPAVSRILTNASRSISKATLVPLSADVPREGQAMLKSGFVRQLSLQPGEVDAVRRSLAPSVAGSVPSEEFSIRSPVWDLLTSFEGSPITLPPASAFPGIPATTLSTFGTALAELRKQALNQPTEALLIPPASNNGVAATRVAVGSMPTSQRDIGRTQQLLNVAVAATKGFDLNTTAARIGMLNLERLEMAPAGIERGELVATIPLAPGEKTSVAHKEWSVTTKEFTSIVTDLLENYSETGVTDNTELAQATTSQIQHANQFNITGTVSGGIPLISGSVTASFGAQDSSSQSATDSRKHATSVTQKASARTKQEHKVTISTTTVTGTSGSTTRELMNPSTTDPIRIDYFSMMRKWRVRLYRYGLRLTYDIDIPEPAGALREAYASLDNLRKAIGPFKFNVTRSMIKTDNNDYLDLAKTYDAHVPLLPQPRPPLVFSYTPSGGLGAHFTELSFTVPNGYWITKLIFDGSMDGQQGHQIGYGIVGTTFFKYASQSAQTPFPSTVLTATNSAPFLFHAEGAQKILFLAADATGVAAQLTVEIDLTEMALAQWQSDVWDALYNAAQTQYYANQQDIAAHISQLEDQLNNVDTLTLRREESDEIMKGVLRFLLGPDFTFMPQNVIDAIKASAGDLEHGGVVEPNYGVAFTGNALGLPSWQASIVEQHEDEVRFINQAIEWENVVSFLYSYFWDVPAGWDFTRQIRHPDANRQAFLRAGSARVVLTVRKGWEKAWVQFAEGGFHGASIDPDHPYLTIAQEIAAYDDRNYPGIRPANPGQSAVRFEDVVYTTSAASVGPSSDPSHTEVEIEVDSSIGFLVGAQVVIDKRVDTDRTNDFRRQESQIITGIRDGHITVQKLDFYHGDGVFPIIQPSDRGALIAEWNEYTPTSGTDIAVTSNLLTIA